MASPVMHRSFGRALPRTLSPKVLQPHALRLRQWQCRQIASAATAPAIEYNEPEPYLPETPQPQRQSRQDAIRQAKPFSEFLTDKFDRQHDYLRISLTERCNLRCLYCMPEEGIQLSPNREILTTAEIHYLSALFVNQGVNKIRLTGGEPTVRKDIIPLMHQIGSLRRNGLKELALTTNGISLHRKLDEMVAAGLTGVNISLDTLDPFQFQLLTRRQGFGAVMKSIDRVKEMNKLGAKIKLKINAVVMRGLNDHQILPFVDMTQDQDVEVRFIEYMPFGGNKWNKNKMMSYEDMLDVIREKYPNIDRLKDAKNDTSKTWQVPGHVGRVGFITSMTHNFCGSCNRLRITSDGNLKVCLHGETEVSLRDLLRKDHGGEPMDEEAFEAIRKLELDRRTDTSLRFDGEEGWMSKEQQLLDVIGAAVKRKKARHAGIGQLENMKNRPMILIDDRHTKRRPRTYTPTPQPRATRASNPWSRIPTHMLDLPAMGSFGQARAYSSDSNGKNSDDPGFGFQSLGSLFTPPPSPGRYSRPREVRAEEETVPRASEAEERSHTSTTQKMATPSKEIAEEETVRITTEERLRRTMEQELGMPSQPVSSSGKPEEVSRSQKAEKDSDSPYGLEASTDASQLADAKASRIGDSVVRKVNKDFDWTPGEWAAHLAGAAHEKELERIKESGGAMGIGGSPRAGRDREDIRRSRGVPTRERKPERKKLGSKKMDLKTPNPFATRTRESISVAEDAEARSDPSAWGLAVADQDQVTMVSGGESPTPVPTSSLAAGVAESIPTSTTKAKEPAPTSITKTNGPESTSTTGTGNRLTHVKSSGEAHMVDVGAKPSTKRTAIAFTHIKIKPGTYKLIEENNIKKGDVLGTARIAGIMAAKRTSDIIPLCHPLSISKAEVDVYLLPPGHNLASCDNSPGTVVAIQARVECVGPTGVEMEALTAAQGAALTVFDMCKAVDKSMTIHGGRVVYKAGGRSGVMVFKKWKYDVGLEKFTETGELRDDVVDLRLRPKERPQKKLGEAKDD